MVEADECGPSPLASDDSPSPAPTSTAIKDMVEAKSIDQPVVTFSARKVKCRASDGEEFVIDWYLLNQSSHFREKWNEAMLKRKKSSHSRKFVFRLPEPIDGELFRKILEWLEAHDASDDLVDSYDKVTGDRVWFEMNDFQKLFFDVDVGDLSELAEAGRLLGIASLYKLTCQSLAALMKDRSPAEIRELFNLPNDLDNTDIANIRRRNRRRRMKQIRQAKEVAMEKAQFDALMRHLSSNLQIKN